MTEKTESETDRQTDRQRDRETERQRDRERQRETERDRERQRAEGGNTTERGKRERERERMEQVRQETPTTPPVRALLRESTPRPRSDATHARTVAPPHRRTLRRRRLFCFFFFFFFFFLLLFFFFTRRTTHRRDTKIQTEHCMHAHIVAVQHCGGPQEPPKPPAQVRTRRAVLHNQKRVAPAEVCKLKN